MEQSTYAIIVKTPDGDRDLEITAAGVNEAIDEANELYPDNTGLEIRKIA